MSRSFFGPPLAALVLCGCSHAGSITHLSADYNKAFADARNEQLLLNILRAAAREPLQFSTMGEINATVHRSVGIDTALENIIAGGANAVSHGVSVEANNEPVISVTPLSNKEFIAGMLKPTTPETLQQFMDHGWDAEFMLPLLVAEYKCPGGDVRRNSGEYPEGDDVRRELVNAGAGVALEEQSEDETPDDVVELNVPDEKALEMMRSGVAGGYKIVSVKRIRDSNMSAVKLKRPADSNWLLKTNLCPEKGGRAAAPGIAFVSAAAVALEKKEAGYIRLRSVEGIIYFLGERLRHCYLRGLPTDQCALTYAKAKDEGRILFRVSSAGEKPYPVLVGARFYDRNYWVSRLDRDDVDRSAKTLSFINQLIALQTDASEIGTTPRVLTIGNR